MAHPAQPYVIISCAMSLDGYLDDGSAQRLILSGPEDFDAVDQLRAEADAILVGANTVRLDDPSLVVRSERRRAARVGAGLAPSPARVVVCGSGCLPAGARVLDDRAETWVYPGTVGRSWAAILADLAQRGIRRLLVEGGAQVIGGLLSEGVVDELRLAVAPIVVGDPGGTRLPADMTTLHGPGRRMTLIEAGPVGDMAVSRYRLVRRADERHLRHAIELSRSCPSSAHAFLVGAVLVGADGAVLAQGFSRETGTTMHAEQVALARARADGMQAGDPRWAGATMYTSLEPCSRRASHPVSCAQEILDAGIGRVVLAWREPSTFVDCDGAERLVAAGVEVVEVGWMADEVRAINAHLL